MTAKTETPGHGADWATATFEGARREQMRRWSRLPLGRILQAIEDMDAFAAQLNRRRTDTDRDIKPHKEP